MSRIGRLVRAAGPALCGALAMGQAPPGQKPSTEQPSAVIRATTRLVQVNVVVRDKKGNYITGLSKEDFVVEDEGKAQEIRFFNFQSPERAPAPAAPAQGVFSNRYAERARLSGGVTVILLDGLNTSWGDQAATRAQVIRYLGQIKPDDRIALYALGHRLKVLHDYTNEPKALVAALSAYLARSSAELTASFQPSIEQLAQAAEANATSPEEAKAAAEAIEGIINALKEEEFFFQAQRIQTTLNAFETIANHLAGMPGRKNVIWVSGSFPLQLGYFERPDTDRGPSPEISSSPNSARYASTRNRRGPDPAPVMVKHGRSRTFGDEFARTVRALNAANISVYPVDARSLSPNPLASQNISTMKVLAHDTGGKAYYSTNDVMNSIREAVEDVEMSYTLAYYPRQQRLDGRYRRINVKVKRPDVVVRYRQGYYDTSETLSGEDAEAAAVQEALWSPLDATGVLLDARMAPIAGTENLLLEVRVDPGGITLDPKANRWVGRLDFYLAQTDEQGQEKGTLSQTVRMELLPQTYETIMRAGFAYRETLKREKDARALRVVVRDAPSGKIGRVVIPLDKPAN